MVAESASRQRRHTGGGFLFVNSSHPDDVKKKGTQRSIRSHSIRSAGSSRPTRKKKPQAITYALKEVCLMENTGICHDQALCKRCPIQKSLGLWPFPGELQPRAQELIYFSEHSINFIDDALLIWSSECGVGLCLPTISHRLVFIGPHGCHCVSTMYGQCSHVHGTAEAARYFPV